MALLETECLMDPPYVKSSVISYLLSSKLRLAREAAKLQ